jgi:Mn2+/Fe2+ NRAMP family transporter
LPKKEEADIRATRPPLILLVILLTSSHKVMGKCVNPAVFRYLGWATFAVMTAAAAGMLIAS